MRRAYGLILLLLVLSLACNFPGFAGDMSPALSPTVQQSSEDDADDPSPDDVDEARPTPAPLETATPEGFVASPTPTPTETPTPTATATPTPEAIEPGPPLSFEEPAWSLGQWDQVEGTSDWEGDIVIHVIGGTPPYRSQLENNEIVDGLTVTARWRLCKAMPATIRVWSADDQEVERQIWVWELGCNDD